MYIFICTFRYIFIPHLLCGSAELPLQYLYPFGSLLGDRESVFHRLCHTIPSSGFSPQHSGMTPPCFPNRNAVVGRFFLTLLS